VRPDNLANNNYRRQQALSEARMERSQALIDITEGLLEPWDVILEACQPQGIAFRKISLRQLLLARPHLGEAAVKRDLYRLAVLLGLEHDPSWTIGWLIDPRAGQRRLHAWLELHRDRTPPWNGFPLAPR
jgi:hypothetical protein